MRLSASQLSAFRSCRRRWYLRWRLGFEEPSTQAQQDGTDTHLAVEHLLGHLREGGADLPPAAMERARALVAAAGAERGEL